MLNDKMAACILILQPLRRIKGIQAIFTLTCRSATSAQVKEDEQVKSNADIRPLKTFVNRNPRNLERIARAHKDIGWSRGNAARLSTNMPTRTFYNRILLQRSKQHTYAFLEHFTRNRVISASTQDWHVRKQLNSSSNVMASYAVGRVLVEKCLRAGYSSAIWTNYSHSSGEAASKFAEAFKSQRFMLNEPKQISNRYRYPRREKPGKWPQAPEID